MKEDPRKLFIQWTTSRGDQYRAFGDAQFNYTICNGSPEVAGAGGGGLHCGKAAHSAAGVAYSSWSIVPDYQYCNYALFFGSSKGVGSGHSAMLAARLYAEARARGMKSVSFDPMCNFSGGRATEWVPIIPGTDGMVALAMCNVLVNELKEYDISYLKNKTNAPYLIGPDMKYVRENGPARGLRIEPSAKWNGDPHPGLYVGDDETNKPMIWDTVDGRAKVYDDPTIRDYAMEGEFEYRGIRCQPVFDLVKEHLKQYTPEKASEISNIQASTIRRIASEFVHAASIGSTITIDGHNLPLRPASAIIFRGGQGHENGLHACFAVCLLNQLVGSADVPGGTLGWPAKSSGYPPTGELCWSPYKGTDGFLETNHFGPTAGVIPGHGPWPTEMPENKHSLNPNCITTVGHIGTNINYQSDRHEVWNKMGAKHRLEMMISWGCNAILSVANPEPVAESLQEIPFIVVYDIFNNEMTEGFADIVLPGVSYLEDLDASGFAGQNFNHAFGTADWCYHIVQPVVELKGERRRWQQVLFDIVCRLGVKDKYLDTINQSLHLEGDLAFKPDDTFSGQELVDRLARKLFGPDHGWEWFREHGFIRWKKKVEDAYWRPFTTARVPIYLEYLVEIGEKIKLINEETGLNIKLEQYTPLISWTPTSVHTTDNPEYDLFCFSYRDILHTGSSTMEQPWLDEASQMNPYTYSITINRTTAAKKGLKEDDLVVIESTHKRKVTGRLKLMDGQHPQVLGIAACSGHWAKGQPVAKGKGTNFDILLELDQEHLDPVTTTIETCARTKIQKLEKKNNA